MDQLRCSFCGKRAHEVQRLIAGPSAHICNECVKLCVDILADTPPRPDSPQILVRMPNGSAYACEQDTPWVSLVHQDRKYEWCTARGFVNGNTLHRVVAVRVPDEPLPAVGAAFSLDTALTEEHARREIDRERLP